jgi:hypothetical protein
MVLMEVVALFKNEEWHKLTEAEQEIIETENREHEFWMPAKAYINPEYIHCIEPCLDRDRRGLTYVYIKDRIYTVKEGVDSFVEKVRCVMKNNLITFN